MEFDQLKPWFAVLRRLIAMDDEEQLQRINYMLLELFKIVDKFKKYRKFTTNMLQVSLSDVLLPFVLIVDHLCAEHIFDVSQDSCCKGLDGRQCRAMGLDSEVVRSAEPDH